MNFLLLPAVIVVYYKTHLTAKLSYTDLLCDQKPTVLVKKISIYFQAKHNLYNTTYSFVICYIFRPFYPSSGRFHNLQ